ncbi:hypothetical protein AB0442_18305 [Kitasatospora sp. NPDC085895]|uniref:hypothetical protein n=1 Tax=Kitasatospora sp. NPDC085895 TaxID=3155057 RepID=UPI00344E18F0
MGSAVRTGAAGVLGGRTAAAVAAGALVLTGAVGAGVWWARTEPQLRVVQRNAQVALEAGGQRTAVAGCAANETALGGGYAVDGAGYATTSEFIGSSAWLAAAYNPGSAPVTLTVYALCVNAPVEFAPRGGYTRRALAFRDRVDKVTAGADGRIHDLTTDGPWAGLAGSALGTDTCVPGFTMTGMEFRADRAVTGHGAAPLPLERLAPLDGSGTAPFSWVASVNPGTRLASRTYPLQSSDSAERRTRIEDPQPPQANYAVGVRAICAKLKDVSVVTAQAAVAAGGTAELTVRCPKKTFAVGGGFGFTVAAAGGGARPQPYFGDGLLYASADGPPPDSSGHVVREWHLAGRNEQTAGTQFHNSVWIEHRSREELTGNGYFDARARGADDQELRGATVPASQQITAVAVCGTVDAPPTRPGPTVTAATPAVPLPSWDVPTVPGPPTPATAGPSGSPGPAASAGTPTAGPSAGGPSRTPGTTPRPGASTVTAPAPGGSASVRPQPPVVAVTAPQQGGTLHRGCEETFTGTARTRPGDRPITDPQHTLWQITGPGGPVTLGTGGSGRFTVPLLADGDYTLDFAATDPDSGLVAHARTTVRIAGCLR